MPSVAACAVGVSAEVVPLRVSEIVTRLPASAVPVMVGVVALVRLSVVVPVVPVPALSEAVARSRVGVTVEVSTVTVRLTLEEFPAASMATIRSTWLPSVNVVDVMLKVSVPLVGGAPSAFAPEMVAVPRTVEPVAPS